MSKLSAPTRKQLSRAEREKRWERALVGGAVIVAVIVVGVVGYGFLDKLVLKPGIPVGRVNGEVIPVSAYQRQTRYVRLTQIQQYNQYAAYISDESYLQYFQDQLTTELGSAWQTALTDLVEDRLIRQEAKRRGITVSQAEVEARMQENFGFFPNGTPVPSLTPSPAPTDVPPTVNPATAAAWTPTPTLTPTATLLPTATLTQTTTPTPNGTATPMPTGTPGPTATPYTAQGYAAQKADYGQYIQRAGLSIKDLYQIVEMQLYREKLLKSYEEAVPATLPQVRARHILLKASTDISDTVQQATAATVLARLNAGEDWNTLAAEYSQDSTVQNGGDLGWFARDQMVAEFAEAAFSLQVGEMVSAPVKTQYGWHLIQVLARDEQRPVTTEQRQSIAQAQLGNWLKEQQAVDASGKLTVETYVEVAQKYMPTGPTLADFTAQP